MLAGYRLMSAREKQYYELRQGWLEILCRPCNAAPKPCALSYRE
jgi:hypothetical protein